MPAPFTLAAFARRSRGQRVLLLPLLVGAAPDILSIEMLSVQLPPLVALDLLEGAPGRV
jgi:hypothetical protein